ncbi:MAG: bifunctional folylpolyglutamate synthase/dihydrofolate synthase [Solirubrobacteraceae bacterium]
MSTKPASPAGTGTKPASPAGTGWSVERAEEHLLGLELFGMRFGLERMRRLLTALGSPQERFSAIHVVGTNGKSSTVRMTAALLEAHGVRAGAFLSPHLTSFTERIRIADEDLAPDALGAAVQRAAAAAAKVDRGLEPGDRVTQFELITAAAFDELARRGVEVAVVEAGLGGRHDATGVLRAPIVVLTNVGLEHTRWLGPTVADIAREKLAVVSAEAVLVLGDATPEVDALARATGARIVRPEPERAALPGYQRTNFAVACAAAREQLGALDAALVDRVGAGLTVPGRLQVVAERPFTVLDGAHNPSGVQALAAALPERPFVGVVSILEDKDAAAMLRALLARCATLVCTAAPNPRALPPATLASLVQQLGASAEIVPDPRAAVARAQALAGPDGAVVATGSIYLIAELVSAPGRRRASAL